MEMPTGIATGIAITVDVPPPQAGQSEQSPKPNPNDDTQPESPNATRTKPFATLAFPRSPEFKKAKSPSSTIATFSWLPKLIQTIQLKQMTRLCLPDTLEEIQFMVNDILRSASKTVKNTLKTSCMEQRNASHCLAHLTTTYYLTESTDPLTEPMLNYLAVEHVFSKMKASIYDQTAQKLELVIDAFKKENPVFNHFVTNAPKQARLYVQISLLTFPQNPVWIKQIDIRYDTQMLKILVTLKEIYRAYTSKKMIPQTTLDKLEDNQKTTIPATLYQDPAFLQWCALLQQNIFQKLTAITS